MKYFSDVLDEVFDTVEELEAAEREYNSILNLGNELEEIEKTVQESRDWFCEEYAKLRDEYLLRIGDCERRKDEINDIINKYEVGEDVNLDTRTEEKHECKCGKAEKKCDKKCKKDDDTEKFFFEYSSSENGKEKEHIVAHSVDEFIDKVRKFIG